MKKILSLIIAILLMLSIMVSCEFARDDNTLQSPDGTTAQQKDDTSAPKQDDPVTPGEPSVTLEDAANVLDTFYKSANGTATAEDWEVVKQILVGEDVFTVSWSVDNGVITIRDNAAGTMKVIDLPEANDTELTYTLVAVLKDSAGQTKTVTYTRVLPVLNSTSNQPGDSTTAATLDDAATLLNSLYKSGNGSVTSGDWEVVKQVKSGSAIFTIEWSVDNAAITIKDNAAGTMKVIDLPEKNDTKVTYTLTAVLKDTNGNTKTLTYTRVMPAFDTTLPADGSTLTISEFNAIAGAQPDKGATTTQKYLVIGTITEIKNTQYGNMYIEDAEGNTLYIYGIYSADGSVRFDEMDPQPKVGDTITVLGVACNYNGAQMKNGWVQLLSSGDGEDSGDGKLYTDFTDDEKAAFTGLCGEVIPFIPNNEYYVEDYSDTDLGEAGFNFYTFGNTQAEFNAYLNQFSSYTLVETYEDTYGDTWYIYQKEDFYVEFSYYDTWDDTVGYCIDVYVYVLTDGGDGETGGGTGGEGDGTVYTDFTDAEKQSFLELFGEVIPFVPNSEYYVDEYSDTELGEAGLNFYAYDITQAEFDAYLEQFSSYTFVESYEDYYGDTWYVYQKGDFYVDISYYYYEWEDDAGYLVDVYIYFLTDGGESGGSGTTTPDTLITNDGQGLPAGTDGVYDVSFDDAIYVKDVTDQGYYLDGCPTTGSPAVLVIPVDFSDFDAATLGYDIDVIKQAFLANGVTDYHSVYDYYYTSSYGQLTLDITVLDFWFRPQHASTYYQNATADYYGEEYEAGDQMIIDEALAYLSTIMDLSEFDSDGNGIIDSIVLINSLEIGEDNFHWAYRYWNLYTDSDGNYYEYDGVSANDYLWASYLFMHESYDAEGNVSYDDTSVLNTYTYIHEFGHVLGADDYYDTAYVGSPMGGCDIMDSMTGDHNAYTKFNLGWIDTSRLVTTDSSVTLTLEDFSQNGDTILLANNWDPTLGAYQEYYIVVYYRSTGLNAGDAGYFSRDGIIVYHVNASLYSEDYNGEIYYDVYYNNTDASDSYGTSENLIEFVKHPDGEDEIFTYVAGDSLPTVTDDSGNALGYTFTVDSLEDGTATLTFTKVA